MCTSAYEGKGLGKETVLLGKEMEPQKDREVCRFHGLISSALFSDSVGFTVIYLMKVSERTNPML